MKVSAPSFMSSPAKPADAPAPVPETPADPSAPPPPPEPPKPATWPAWFAPVDNALIVLALVFAFLMASFAARNSDVFRHLAGGQRLLNGGYALGADPFSYTGESRPWVNPSWLFDLTLYAVYSADPSGAVAVVLKAFAFAAALGALLAFRRPGHAGWPWAVAILAAALAGSRSALLQPLVFGTLFFSLLLLLVFRGDWGAGRKRTLLLVGAVSWLWGGFDPFAIVAPVLLTAVALGGWVQALLNAPRPVALPPELARDGDPSPNPVPDPKPPAPEPPPPPPPPPEPPPVPDPPDTRTLLLAAAVALLGVLLNPTFVIGLTKSPAEAVAQLVPYELAFSSAFDDDPLLREYGYSLLTQDYWTKPLLGKNASSIGLAVLVLAGALGMAVGVGRLPAGWVALWLAALLLCFAHYRFVPLFAAAAVPLVGGLLNALSARLPLGTVADPWTKGVLAASRLGRIVCVPAFVLLVAATIPGWLHPSGTDAALARRVEWRIAGDEALVRGVERLQRWRESGALPSDARGLIVHPEFGDYAAWFAPAEKVFVNGRYRFHAAELPDLAAAREALLFPKRDGPRKPAAAVADKYGTEYVALGRPFVATNTNTVLITFFDLAPGWLTESVVWHLDGRAAVIGRTGSPRAAALRAALANNPAREAFAPQPPERWLPNGPITPPLNPDAGWLATVFLPPPPPAAFRDDGRVIAQFAALTAQIEQENNLLASYAVGGWAHLRPPADDAWALPLLLHRIARQAVHQTPDDPLAYALLADAFALQPLPEFEPQDAARQRLTALARAAARLAPLDRATAAQRQDAAGVWGSLLAAQLELGQLDSARDTLKELRKLLTAEEEAGTPPPALAPLRQQLVRGQRALVPHYRRVMRQDLPLDEDDFAFEGQAKKSGRNEPPSAAALMKKLEDAAAAVVGRLNDAWDGNTRADKPGVRAIRAAQLGLTKAGIAGLVDANKLSGESAGMNPLAIVLNLVNLELNAGHLEIADEYLTKLETELASNEPAKAELAELKLKKLRFQGNYREAMAVLDDLARTRLPKPLDPEAKAKAVADPFAIAEYVTPFVGPFAVTPRAFDPRKDNPDEFLARVMDAHPLGRGTAERVRLLGEARHFYQRGQLALFAGDVAEARRNFAQVLAPQGVPVGPVLQLAAFSLARFNIPPQAVLPPIPFDLVARYVQLIDRHANTPNPGAAK